LQRLSPLCRSFQAHYFPFPSFDFNSPDMQFFAFLITLIALFSAALASPIPVQAIQGAGEPIVELIVREVPLSNQMFHREVTTDTESGVNLHILARENKSFEEYVQEMTGGKKTDSEDIEPRLCRLHMCQ
jgi:hypothetical protein